MIGLSLIFKENDRELCEELAFFDRLKWHCEVWFALGILEIGYIDRTYGKTRDVEYQRRKLERWRILILTGR